MNTIEKIKAYFKREELDFNEGVRLYTMMPNHRRPLAQNMKNHPNWEVLQKRLIFELEMMVGYEATNRQAVHQEKAQPIIHEELKDYEYKIPVEQLTEKERKLVTKKSQYYNFRDALKKELVEIRTLNDAKSITRRAEIMDDIVFYTESIKYIHSVLSKYVPKEDGTMPQAPAEPNFIIQINEELDKEFFYVDMNDEARKELLTSLEATYPGVKERAEKAEKKRSREINQSRAARMYQMIQLLNNYFENADTTSAEPAE